MEKFQKWTKDNFDTIGENMEVQIGELDKKMNETIEKENEKNDQLMKEM